ncbi:MAG: copper chaperone PCu(A)C [Parashewanella sp.]
MPKSSLISSVFGLVIMFISQIATAADLIIDNAWIRAMPPTSRVIPIYLTIKNPSATANALISISSPRGYVEVHQTIMENGMMKMQAVDAVPVTANGVAKLEPAGYHGMMMNFTDSVPAKGESVPLTLKFKNGETISVKAKVKMSADSGGHNHHH